MEAFDDCQAMARFFNDRFCVAFPDIDRHPEITDKMAIRSRLHNFFSKPLTTADTFLLGNEGDGNVSSFSLSPFGPYEFMGVDGGGGYFALDIGRIVPICRDWQDYTACVYIESQACIADQDIEGHGDGSEIHPFHTSGRELSGWEFNSNCFYDGLLLREFTSDEIIELRLHSKKYNLLLCSQYGAVGQMDRKQDINDMLAGILHGNKTITDLKKLILGFRKPEYTYAPVDQRPFEPKPLSPDILTNLLREVQQSRSGN